MAAYRVTQDGGYIRVSDGAYIPADSANRDYQSAQAWIAAGNTPEPYVAPPSPPRLVAKRLIIDRLQTAGKLAAARSALNAQDIYTQERWNVRSEIYADDETARALLLAIGADPDAILAP
jgi:hypothetical protein